MSSDAVTVRAVHATIMVLCSSAAALHGCTSDDPESREEPVISGTPVEISAEPTLALGVVEGDTLQQFHGIVTPFLLPNGHLVVPDRSLSLRIFDANGTFVKTLGGGGEGPGEFSSLDAAWPRGDTIEVFDGDLYRITRFLPDDSVETVALEPVPSAQRAIPGTVEDGWALSGVGAARRDGRDEIRVHYFGRSGSHEGEIGSVEGMTRFHAGNYSGPTPLSPRPLVAVDGDEIYLSESTTSQLRVVDPEGSTVRVITWEGSRLEPIEPIVAEVIDSALQRPAEDLLPPDRGRFEAAPIPDRLSVFWGLLVDAEGFIWVRPYEPLKNAAALGGLMGSGPGGTWKVLAPSGASVGEVVVPSSVEPRYIDTDAMVGVRTDEFGVEYVQVHRLHRAN